MQPPPPQLNVLGQLPGKAAAALTAGSERRVIGTAGLLPGLETACPPLKHSSATAGSRRADYFRGFPSFLYFWLVRVKNKVGDVVNEVTLSE